MTTIALFDALLKINQSWVRGRQIIDRLSEQFEGPSWKKLESSAPVSQLTISWGNAGVRPATNQGD